MLHQSKAPPHPERAPTGTIDKEHVYWITKHQPAAAPATTSKARPGQHRTGRKQNQEISRRATQRNSSMDWIDRRKALQHLK